MQAASINIISDVNYQLCLSILMEFILADIQILKFCRSVFLLAQFNFLRFVPSVKSSEEKATQLSSWLKPFVRHLHQNSLYALPGIFFQSSS